MIKLIHYQRYLNKNRPVYIPLSYSQERLWFVSNLEGSIHYHIPILYRVSGDLNADLLEQSYQTIVNRHESLRTTFSEKDGQPYQVVMPKNKWKLHSLSYKENKEAAGLIKELVNLPFNLETDHMLRVHLVELSANDFFVD